MLTGQWNMLSTQFGTAAATSDSRMLPCFAGMPAELVAHFDPRTPLLAGAVAPAEAGTGFLRLRVKRHRWFPKTLKTRDPLIFSIGAACGLHQPSDCCCRLARPDVSVLCFLAT